jgi:hypothetical protein
MVVETKPIHQRKQKPESEKGNTRTEKNLMANTAKLIAPYEIN